MEYYIIYRYADLVYRICVVLVPGRHRCPGDYL